MSTLQTTLSAFRPIILGDMDAAGLHRRAETKYLLPEAELLQFLSALREDYFALEMAGRRAFPYRTEYFDTPDFGCYADHHNGAAMRIKVRQRVYGHTGAAFFEIKQKQRDGRIHKIRRHATALSGTPLEKARQLITHPRLAEGPLLHTLTTAYTRITLCAFSLKERVTIDTDILLIKPDNAVKALAGWAIIEVKQAQIDHASPAVRWLKARHIRPVPFSKYVAGMALHHPGLKRNNFRPQLTKIQRPRHEAIP